MRKDMAKKLCERPRYGSSVDLGNFLKPSKSGDPEGMALREPMRARWRSDYIELNDYLAPLRRYLGKQVGRPWNDVYSEISKELRLDKETDRHVLLHVSRIVSKVTIGRDGEWLVDDRAGFGPKTISRQWLYVDPHDGTLKRGLGDSRKQKWRKMREEKNQALSKRMRQGKEAEIQYHFFGEKGWWQITLSPRVGERHWCNSCRKYSIRYPLQEGADVVFSAGLSSLPIAELYGRDGVYASAKRQLSKKEIRDLKLREKPGRVRKW